MPPCNGDCNQGRECICECKPPKQWQSLSDDEIEGFINPLPQNIQNDDLRDVISAIEAKLRENNNG